MGFFILLYDTLLYNPLLNALVALYDVIPGQSFGVAVILLTLLVRIVMMPLFGLSIKTQFKMAELQPKLKELQKKLKGNKEELTKATMELYKAEGVNPFSGILVLLLQLPIFIALFHLFRSGFDGDLALRLYPFVPVPAFVDTAFFGFFDLASSSFIVAVVAAVAQFFQAKTATPPQQKGSDAASQIQQRMVYIFPAVTFFILTSLPSAIGLYWITTSVFSIWQQWTMTRSRSHAQRVSSNN
jgi:YidC/Oxa1 family membrane protein insertase